MGDGKKKKKDKSGGYFIVIILFMLVIALAVTGYFVAKKMYFPEKVSFPETEHTLYVGDVLVMPAKITPKVKNNELVYKSSNEEVCAVSQSGVISAVGTGRAEISAEHTFSGKSCSMTVIVKESVLRIELENKKETVLEGEQTSVKYEIISTGFSKVNLKFSSSDERVATVDSDGIITAHDAGEAYISVTDTESGLSERMKLTVIAPLEEIYFKIGEVDLLVGDIYEPELIFIPLDASDKKTEYKISPESVAEIDKNGKVTGVSSGSAVLTATHTATGKTAKMRINVYHIAEKITLNKTQLLVDEGSTQTVIAEVSPATTKDKTLTWTSSDSSVAEVTVSGAGTANIKGISEGTCKITATSNSNPKVKAELTVTVKKNESHTVKKETYINGILVVNKTYGLPQSYNSGGGLTPQTKAAFAEMKKAAADEGIELRIASGYRSYEYQKELYNRYLGNQSQQQVDRFSARPGYSEHQTGLAIDVNNASASFVGTPAQLWLEKNCVKYGFIIRYPKDKEAETGYMYEAWHVRYLGKETAQKVYDSGLCLEEYLGIESEYAF